MVSLQSYSLKKVFFFFFLVFCVLFAVLVTQIYIVTQIYMLKFIELYTKNFLKSNLLYINLRKKKC